MDKNRLYRICPITGGTILHGWDHSVFGMVNMKTRSIINNYELLVKILLEMPKEFLDLYDDYGKTCLNYYLYKGNTNNFKLLLNHCDVNIPIDDRKGISLLEVDLKFSHNLELYLEIIKNTPKNLRIDEILKIQH